MKIKLSCGEDLELPIPNNISTGKTKFVCGINKSGSTLFHTLLHDLCKADGTVFINVPKAAFEMGLTAEQWESDPKLSFTLNYSAILGGFRFLPEYVKTSPHLKSAVKGLLVRDPRDAMVSLYYSSIISHPIPKQGALKKKMINSRQKGKELGINEFVIQRANSLRVRYRSYFEDSRFMKDSKIWRYEDIIFQKRAWVDEICKYYQLNVDGKTKEKLAQKHDVIPDSEDTSKHIRKVVPEQYKDKLTSETIEQLVDIFSEELNRLSYL